MTGTILIVDDDPNLLDGIRRILRREPYEVITSLSGKEALEILGTKPVDIVISDQDMPGIKGTDLLKVVRELYPAITRFLLTGKATLENAIDAINSGGISRLLLKPCDPLDLIMSIRQGLQQHRLMEAAFQLWKENMRKSAMLHQLEERYPDITRVERDSDGAISIGEIHGDLDQLLSEIDEYLKKDPM